MSLSPELLSEIRRLHFHTRRLADQGIAGSYRSAFRGSGIEFEEVREYSPGDDVRSIDWKVTARTNFPHVKSYREERELTVMIAVDVSASTLTGTTTQLRESLIAKLGAVLTMIALKNNDKVGLVTFSDRIETYHPPRKARTALWRILHEVLAAKNFRPATDFGQLFSFLRQVLRRKAIIFVISDFRGPIDEFKLATLAKRHDLTMMQIRDPSDLELPTGLLVELRDPESGQQIMVDTSDSEVRSTYSKLSKASQEEFRALLLRHTISLVEFQTNQPFINELRRYFDKRTSTLYQTRAHRQLSA